MLHGRGSPKLNSPLIAIGSGKRAWLCRFRVTLGIALSCSWFLQSNTNNRLEAQELPPATELPAPAQEVVSTNQDRYQVPETENVAELQLFIRTVSAISPRSNEEFKEHRLKFPVAIETASKRILELTNDPTSADYLDAQYHILASRILRTADLTSEERKQVGLALLERLASPIEAEMTLPLVKSFAVELEATGDSALLDEQCQTIAELLKTNESSLFQAMAKFLDGIRKRIHLKGEKLSVSGIDTDQVEWTWEKILANSSENRETQFVYLFVFSSANNFSDTELDRLKIIYSKYRAQGLEIVLADISSTTPRKELKPSGEVLICPSLQLSRSGKENFISELSLTKIPFGIILSPDGTVVETNVRFDKLEMFLGRELGTSKN